MFWLHFKLRITCLKTLICVLNQLFNSSIIDPYLRPNHGVWAHGLIVNRESLNEEEVLFKSLGQIDFETGCGIFEIFILRTSLNVLIIFKNVDFLFRFERFRLLI